jgi:hypothetical protein
MVKKALLVGINYKSSPENELRGCIKDVQNMREILTNNCGYSSTNLRMLTEESPIKPLRKNIEDNIAWLVSGCVAGDTLVFYYSGHGAFIKDNNADETDGKDEVIIPLDYEKAGVITDDYLRSNMVGKVPAGVTMWAFTDCCHSGTMIDLKYNYKSMCKYNKGKIVKGVPYNFQDWSNQYAMSVEKGNETQGTVCLFSGCMDVETSADAYIQKTYQGAFSFCLMEFLKSNMETKDGKVRFKGGVVKLRNLLKEINARLDINGYVQNSQLSVGKVGDVDKTFDL